MVMRITPQIVNGGRWRKTLLPWVVNGGRWRQCSQVWVASGGSWHPLYDKLELPYRSTNWVNYSGSQTSLPGMVYGDTVGYVVFNIPTVRRVVGIQIRVLINGKHNNWESSGGFFNVLKDGRETNQWEAQPQVGEQVSPVLSCDYAAGEEIHVWLYVDRKHKNGKLYGWIQIENVIYG